MGGNGGDKEVEESGKNTQLFSRRSVLQWSAAGVGLTGIASSSASAASDFVNVLGTDPSNYPLVRLNVLVETQAGRNGELTKEDFDVIENGVEQTVESFDFRSTSADIAFVFDDSGSMGNEISTMKREVKDLTDKVEASGIDARYSLVSFRDTVGTDLEFTDDSSQLKSAVDSLNANGGGDFPEDNFDAVKETLGLDFRSSSQKFIIDITDALSHYRGDGTNYSDITLEELATDLNESGAIYISVSPDYDDPQASMKFLAEQTDSLWLDINGADFDEILQRITKIVVSSYVLDYRTDIPPGAARPIGVVARDPERGTGEGSGTVEVPSDAEPPGPGEAFYDLKSTKLGLADRIETLSDGTIDEKSAVSSVIDALENAAVDGTISATQATNAVERMKLGEEVTERTLVGAGGGSPDGSANDYNIAGKSAESAIDAVFSALFALLPMDKIAKKIPFGKRAIDTAKKYGKKAIKRVIDATLSSVGSLSRFVRRETDDIAKDLVGEVSSKAIDTGKGVVQAKTEKTTSVNSHASDVLLGLIEADTHELLGTTDLSEGLATLNDAAAPAGGLGFDGDLSGATTAADAGIDSVNDELESTREAFDLFNQAFDVANVASKVITVITFVGIFTGGILSTIAAVGGLLLDIATAALKLLKSGTGFLSLTRLRDTHTETIDNIVAGGVN